MDVSLGLSTPMPAEYSLPFVPTHELTYRRLTDPATKSKFGERRPSGIAGVAHHVLGLALGRPAGRRVGEGEIRTARHTVDASAWIFQCVRSECRPISGLWVYDL